MAAPVVIAAFIESYSAIVSWTFTLAATVYLVSPSAIWFAPCDVLWIDDGIVVGVEFF
jgi:hypothetical protein